MAKAASHPWARIASVAALVAAAAGVRFAWACEAALDVRQQFRFDMTSYDWLAGSLARGEGYVGFDAQPTGMFPPGYPWLLSLAYRLFGTDLSVAWALNALSGAVTCLLVYALGKRVFDPAVGVVAAALFAFYPSDVFYAGLTMSETVFGAAFTAILYLLVRGHEHGVAPPRRWFVFGMLLGGAALIRGVALPFAAVPIAFWLLSGSHRAGAWRRAVACALGVALAVTPWMARNGLRLGAPVFSTDATLGVWQRHCPAAFGSQNLETWRAYLVTFAHLQTLANPAREIVKARTELRAGLHYFLTHPRHELSMVLPGIGYLFEHGHWAFAAAKSFLPSGTGATWILFTRDTDRAWEVVADAYFFILLALAALAVPAALRDPTGMGRLLVLTVAYVAVLHSVVVFSEARYNSPLTPILTVFAAATLVGGWRTRPARTAEAS